MQIYSSTFTKIIIVYLLHNSLLCQFMLGINLAQNMDLNWLAAQLVGLQWEHLKF